MRVSRLRSADAIDLEHLEQGVGTRGYQMILIRAAETIERKRSQLEQNLSEGDTAKVRGFLEGARAILGIAGILKREILERERKKGKR